MPKISHNEKKMEVKKILRSYYMEVNEDKVHNILIGFIRKLVKDENTAEFGK